MEKDHGFIDQENFVWSISIVGLVIVALLFLGACSTVHDIIPFVPPAHADCVLADELQKPEAVTPLEDDHDLSLQETWDALKSHLLEEKGIADRSNDKTKFVNDKCVGAGNGTAAK